MNVCIACSVGGHLTQALQVVESFEGQKVFFITFHAPAEVLPKNYKVYKVEDPRRTILSPFRFVVNALQTLAILCKERPDIVFSTGAGVAVAACYFGKLLGAKVIFLESASRVDTRSLTGRMVYPIADLFLVQWPELAEQYNHVEYVGTVI